MFRRAPKTFMNAIQSNIIGGETWVRASGDVFASELARQMALDVLSERGFWVVWRSDLSTAE